MFRPSMAPNVTAAAAHIVYDMQPPESLHRTKYQIKAKKNQDLEHTELETFTMNVHIPLPNLAYNVHIPLANLAYNTTFDLDLAI